MKWYGLIFLAIIIEGVITYAKTLFVNRVFQWQILASMVFGVGCALAFGVDLFAIAGIEAAVPYVGQVLTGVLLSRGSNYIFDLIKQLQGAKELAASLEIPEDQTHVSGHEDEGIM